MRNWLGVLLTCAAAAMSPAASPFDSSVVTGIVRDKAAQKPLAGARVTLNFEDKNWVDTKLTDANGVYLFDLVYPPGRYLVLVEMPGYATARVPAEVLINVTKTIVPPVDLESSAIAASPASRKVRLFEVNTSDTARMTAFDPVMVQSLPLSGVRTFDQLALLVPGVFDVPAASGTGPGVGPGVGTAGQFSVNGGRGRNNNFLVDMSDNNDQDVGVRRQGYVSLISQSIESIQNYQVISGNYQAEFGRNSGSIVNAISKSGGNAVHGTVYGYYTGDKLSARALFDQVGGPAPGENVYQRGQYGVAAGGPFVKDKTFWFGSFERQRIQDRPEKHFVVPTLDQRTFFGYSPLKASPGNRTFRLRDGSTMVLDDMANFLFSQGIAAFGLAGRGVWGLIPPPNNQQGPYGFNTYTEQMRGDGDGAIFSFKVDHRFSAQSDLTVRYNFTQDKSILPVSGNAIHSSINPHVRTQNFSLFLNGRFSTNTSNQARFSLGRTNLEFREVPGSPFLFGSNDQAELLRIFDPGDIFKSILSTPVKTDYGTYGSFGSTGILGQLNIRPFSSVGVDAYNFPQLRVNNTFQIADTFIHRTGAHGLRFGVDIRRGQQNSRLDRNLRPIAEFSGALGTALAFPNSPRGVVRGTDLASLGYATGFLQTLIPDFNDDGRPDFDTIIGLRFTEVNFFALDDWRITPKLTLNYGVRYEYNTPPGEVNRKIESTLTDPVSKIPAPNASSVASFVRSFENIVAALNSVIGGRDTIFDADKKNWAPRIGLAWDPTGSGKMAIRCGYGIFYDQNISAVTSQSRNVFPHLLPLNSGGIGANLEGLFLTNPQYTVLREPVGVNQTRETAIVRIGSLNTTGTPSGYFQGIIGFLNSQYKQGVAFTLPARKLLTPYAQHYHLTVEREMLTDLVASIGYFGSRGVHLTRFRSPNGGTSGTPNFDSANSRIVSGFVALGGQTLPPAARKDLNLGAYTIFENSASSTYHSLQVSLAGRFSAGLQFMASYAWSHVLDDVSDVFDGLGFFARPQSETNLRAERASANFDVRHRFTASYIWTPGWGGRNVLLGGWSLNGILTLRTGQPFTVNTAFDINNDGTLTDRLNTTQGIQRLDQGRIRYALPPDTVKDGLALGFLASPGKDGLVGRNTFRAPGVATLDTSIFKRFALTEKVGLEFRTEIFNLFNRTHFGVPVRILETPGFGQSVDTSVNARQVQFALKLLF